MLKNHTLLKNSTLLKMHTLLISFTYCRYFSACVLCSPCCRQPQLRSHNSSCPHWGQLPLLPPQQGSRGQSLQVSSTTEIDTIEHRRMNYKDIEPYMSAFL